MIIRALGSKDKFVDKSVELSSTFGLVVPQGNSTGSNTFLSIKTEEVIKKKRLKGNSFSSLPKERPNKKKRSERLQSKTMTSHLRK